MFEVPLGQETSAPPTCQDTSSQEEIHVPISFFFKGPAAEGSRTHRTPLEVAEEGGNEEEEGAIWSREGQSLTRSTKRQASHLRGRAASRCAGHLRGRGRKAGAGGQHLGEGPGWELVLAPWTADRAACRGRRPRQALPGPQPASLCCLRAGCPPPGPLTRGSDEP